MGLPGKIREIIVKFEPGQSDSYYNEFVQNIMDAIEYSETNKGHKVNCDCLICEYLSL